MVESVRLYVLAEKYDVVELRNVICKALYHGRKSQGLGPSKDAIELAYDNLPQESPLRRMLVDWYAWHVAAKWFVDRDNQKWLTELPEFAGDLAVALSKKACKSIKDPLETSMVNYFEFEGPSGVKEEPE